MERSVTQYLKEHHDILEKALQKCQEYKLPTWSVIQEMEAVLKKIEQTISILDKN